MAPRARSTVARSIVNKKRAAPVDSDTKEDEKHAKYLKKEDPISPFMELPGELRNTIYSFCQDTDGEKLIHNPPGTHSNARRGSPRSFYNLAQVSQQVRREYLPIYASRITHRISSDKIVPYIRTFGRIAPRIAGKLTIQLPDAHTMKWDEPDSLDFGALVRLCRNHPGIRIVPECHSNRVEDRYVDGHRTALSLVYYRNAAGYMNDYRISLIYWLAYCIPTLSTNPMTKEQAKWAKYFDTAVAAMYVSPVVTRIDGTMLDVRVEVKVAHTEWWMGFEQQSRSLCYPGHNLEVKSWIKKTGLCEELVGLTVCGAK